MYKFLLCWRYLRTRYIALASIISVMLGVATMIVVNAVMAGFSNTMQDRLHGTLSDIVVDSINLNGFDYPDQLMEAMEKAGAGDIEAMSPSLQLFGLAVIKVAPGQHFTKEVQIIGIRPEDHAKVADFAEYLVHQPKNGSTELTPAKPTFEVPQRNRNTEHFEENLSPIFQGAITEEMIEAYNADLGMIIGYALGTHHNPDTGEDLFIAPEGQKVILHFPTAGAQPTAQTDEFPVVSYFKSGMSEYDAMQVFVPLERLQYMRGQDGFVNQIQIKAKSGVDLDDLTRRIRRVLNERYPTRFLVSTWKQKQGPLLAAVEVEQNILNILLFFIIAVAGFGILGIFSMIVVEKTRDIGILKALGASNAGVRGIFLGYGLSLGLVGSLVGMVGGLTFVAYINEIEDALSVVTGREVFDDAIYYFPEIPTLVDPWTVTWIVLGAVSIAVAASVWPAQRASKMHPVQALRYE